MFNCAPQDLKVNEMYITHAMRSPRIFPSPRGLPLATELQELPQVLLLKGGSIIMVNHRRRRHRWPKCIRPAAMWSDN